ncbi:hypothetical protein NM688_g4058 [Phlebia brevispora]|uniref:Uncharacterized protein n=1 Tax=Phlebia brevispora TaxID=194682 RepID=A0ACC1T481_9APHY|nr:hypothetical protein NM688_g4058 [Phlebia brevispora]
MQAKVDQLNQTTDQMVRRALLVEIGDFIRSRVLPRKGQRDHGHSRGWWKYEMWAYVSRYLPAKGRSTMDPDYLANVTYKKYKDRAMTKSRAKSPLKGDAKR